MNLPAVKIQVRKNCKIKQYNVTALEREFI